MTKDQSLPFVSYIIPTLNAQVYLRACLESIRKQDYPTAKYEIFVIDGGSSDETVKIAKEFKAIILKNPWKDAETGKSLGIEKSKGEIIVLLDSDNEIIKKDWLRRMVRPLLLDNNLFGVESFYFPRKGESIFNTYSMLVHIADPFSRCLAGKLKEIAKDGYTEYEITSGTAYPLGANGFLWKKKIITETGAYKPKFEESNFSYYITLKGYRKFARVSGYGIYHDHINSLGDFIGKRFKIGNKFLKRTEEKKRTWIEGVSKKRFIYSVVYCTTFIGPLVEGLINSVRTGQAAWLLHPLLSFISVGSYAVVFARRRLKI